MEAEVGETAASEKCKLEYEVRGGKMNPSVTVFERKGIWV